MTNIFFGNWIKRGAITNYQARNDLILITDNQNVQAVFQHIGKEMEGDEGLLVKAKNGEYVEIYKFYGIPYLYKYVWKLEMREG